MRRAVGPFALLLILAWVSAPLEARVTHIVIESRTDVLHGKPFGDSGAYERLSGQIDFSVRVDNPHNSRIVDLRNAVNLPEGSAPQQRLAVTGNPQPRASAHHLPGRRWRHRSGA
jgi:hypothetical protein